MNINPLKIIKTYHFLKTNNIITNIIPFGSCRFEPSCSIYSYQAFKRYGTMKGIILSLKRIVRCHPFSKGGYDPLK
jgi:putative membrane protein insertion efficiency factor